MSPTRRIFLNIIATYGRSMYALVCGLFISRWVLATLGKTDFGLYGVVGGMTVFIAFLNTLLSSATSRFYAFAEGESKKYAAEGNAERGVDECRKWFSTALLLHVLVPIVLIIIGYPLGMHAVEHWLTIPPDRVDACRWVFRFVCISCFVGMVNVPFQAMYTAKQYIAELTLYSFATTTVNVAFIYFMVTHPDDWLVKYALWMCLVSIVPQAIICLRAIAVFPECRFRAAYAWNRSRVIRLSSYAFWQAFGGLGVVFRGQGIQVLINKYFGPGINASMAIANQVSGQTQTLASAMQGAFQPAIVTALGTGDVELARRMSYRASKFALALTLIFCLPLSLEIDYVIALWLKTPPPYSAGLCLCMIVFFIVDKASIGQCLACNATGKIAGYQAVGGSLLIMCLPIAWIMVASGLGVYSIGWAIVLTGLGNSISRVFFARKLIGMSAKKWLLQTVIPILVSSVIAIGSGLIVCHFMHKSLLRLVVNSLLVEGLFLPLLWSVVLDTDEQEFVRRKLKRYLKG